MKSFILKTAFLATFALLSSAMPGPQKRELSGYSIQVKSDTAFCSFMPPYPGDNVGATESNGIPFCTNATLGGQVFPDGFIKTAHYLKRRTYAQVTGTIDRSAYKLSSSDGGGQYDNLDVKKATCNGFQYFVNLIEPDANVFCIRCCQRPSDCNLGISTYGCEKIITGNYD